MIKEIAIKIEDIIGDELDKKTKHQIIMKHANAVISHWAKGVDRVDLPCALCPKCIESHNRILCDYCGNSDNKNHFAYYNGFGMMMHLNDAHHLTFDEIAGELERLGINVPL